MGMDQPSVYVARVEELLSLSHRARMDDRLLDADFDLREAQVVATLAQTAATIDAAIVDTVTILD